MTIVPTSLEVVRYVRVWSSVGAHWAHPSCGLALCLVSSGLLGACVALSSRTVGEPAEGSFARFLSIFQWIVSWRWSVKRNLRILDVVGGGALRHCQMWNAIKGNIRLHRLYDFLQFVAMDVSARTTMKGAAKCDKHCELQNSVNW